jgi:hypothetical protein
LSPHRGWQASLVIEAGALVRLIVKQHSRSCAPVERLRKICRRSEPSERLSHGEPTFFVGAKDGKGGKVFVSFVDDHHGDGIVGITFPAEPGAQAMLIEADPRRFYRPPYVGPSGWVGLRLDVDLDWDEVAEIAEESFRLVAPKRAMPAPGGTQSPRASLRSAPARLGSSRALPGWRARRRPRPRRRGRRGR